MKPSVMKSSVLKARTMRTDSLGAWRLVPALRGVLVAVAVVASSPLSAQITTSTPEYKCFATLADQTQIVFYFYDEARLPDRFTDEANYTTAKIPNSVRQQIRRLHECALRSLAFSDPTAVALEAALPQ